MQCWGLDRFTKQGINLRFSSGGASELSGVSLHQDSIRTKTAWVCIFIRIPPFLAPGGVEGSIFGTEPSPSYAPTFGSPLRSYRLGATDANLDPYAAEMDLRWSTSGVGASVHKEKGIHMHRPGPLGLRTFNGWSVQENTERTQGPFQRKMGSSSRLSHRLGR